VILSNHGDRQLDAAVSPLDVLAESRARISAPILIDSGFRRGTDIVKALALGANAVLLGLLRELQAAGYKKISIGEAPSPSFRRQAEAAATLLRSPFPVLRKAAGESGFCGLSGAGQSAPSQGSGSVTCPEAGLELDAQFGHGLPRRECIGEESDEFRVIATCRQFGN